MEKLQKVLLPRSSTACLAQKLRYSLNRLLVVVLWLQVKCKYFKSRTAKKACEAFVIRAKQLSKLQSGKVYLGGPSAKRSPEQKEGPKQRLKKKKSVRAKSAIKDDEDEEEEDYNGTRQKMKDQSH